MSPLVASSAISFKLPAARPGASSRSSSYVGMNVRSLGATSVWNESEDSSSIQASSRKTSRSRSGSVSASANATQRSSYAPSSEPCHRISGFQIDGPADLTQWMGLELPKVATKLEKKGGLAQALSEIKEEASPLKKSLPSSPSSSFSTYTDIILLERAQERHEVFKADVVRTAFHLASQTYSGQLFLDGSTQISHAFVVAEHLANLGLDPETVAAGLLHDCLRENPGFRGHLLSQLPNSVVQLVDRVTTMSKISNLYRDHRGRMSDERLQHMLLAMEDVKAVIIKLACRVHNMRLAIHLPIGEREAMAQETLDIYSIVANRLGVWSLKAELEDLAFAVLHPEEHELLRLEACTRQDPVLLEETINTIKAELDAAQVEYVDLSGRPKNLYGIWLKMKKSGLTSLNQVHDTTALRVVVTNKHDCYRAQRVVQNVYRCMSGRSKDFIKIIKKSNGYQSLHETIYGAGDMPVEVQIRTHKMHYIAEYGFAAHWKYKENLGDENERLDKEVQYKKWLTAYKLGVHDMKIRPNGSPPTDSSLKALGMHLLNAETTAWGKDAFPHCPERVNSGDLAGRASDSSEIDPFLRLERFKLEQPIQPSVSVVVHTQDGVEAREFPQGVTAQQLSLQLHVPSLEGYALTVNQRLPPSGLDEPLQSGDLVQVLPISQVLNSCHSQQKSNLVSAAV